MIREEVAELFGDYGVGRLGGAGAGGVSGMIFPLFTFSFSYLLVVMPVDGFPGRVLRLI